MIVARFDGPEALSAAVRRLRAAGIATDTRTPVALPEDEEGGSPIPRFVLGAGLLAAVGGFLMQWYAAASGYKLLIGGRPDFFWTSYLVYGLECGVMAATLTAFVGFLAGNRMPDLYDSTDEIDSLRDASRDGWFLLATGADGDARRMLRALGALRLELVA